MINLLRVGSCLAIVLAIVSANLWRELRSERQLTASLRVELAESAGREQNPAPQAQAVVRAEPATPAAPPVGIKPPPAAPAPEPAPPPRLGAPVVRGSVNDPMQDPEYRKARFIQERMQLKRIYTEVGPEVGLSESETEQLFDLLAEQPSSPRQRDDAIRALVGPDRQTRWEDYQLTLSARSRASQMAGMLASSGAPLTEMQLQPLRTALIAEEKYVREYQPATVRPGGPVTPEMRAQQQEESIDRQEQSNQRYLLAAAPYMSPQQLALVRETLEQQIAMSRANARMQRQRTEAR